MFSIKKIIIFDLFLFHFYISLQNQQRIREIGTRLAQGFTGGRNKVHVFTCKGL